jgi:hypothetical protein
MRAGVWNLGFGLVAVAAGLSGRFQLMFTNSSNALVIAGAALAALGLFQLWRSRSQ